MVLSWVVDFNLGTIFATIMLKAIIIRFNANERDFGKSYYFSFTNSLTWRFSITKMNIIYRQFKSISALRAFLKCTVAEEEQIL